MLIERLWQAGLVINANTLELIGTLPIGDLHSGYGRELAKEIEKCYLQVWLQKSGKSLPLNTTVVLDAHVNEINKHNRTLADKLYDKFYFG